MKYIPNLALLALLLSPVHNPAAAAPTPAEAEAAAPAAWRLDCGTPGTTALCSATNSGAHCDPVSGELTIILAGTCSACRCVSVGECARACGMGGE
ncbi:hypothetical protein GGS23DRAFT_120718 [Durotheca rogersii]|uniref:uncharacterized protein n=1 Tax=Durotheca rogersii TaxID=419775 RepID=UPI00221E88A6|nr:uncharacterized protein GGS23DRAFT_120718 [Durotheca rogersii]KAI5861959.1 hypothetical protein GGS23DRAFT_120718 [Durotheca rogersii]